MFRNIFQDISKSKFVRSVFLRVLSIFLIVSIAIVVIVFFSFSSEINKNIVADRQKQLVAIESTISDRTDEITGIAYNISQDSTFYIESMQGRGYTGYEMSTILERYLVGNTFIDYLAFYRLSDPDTIYTSTGEMSVHEFWSAYLDFTNYDEKDYLEQIKKSKDATVMPLGRGEKESYFTYVYSLPQFSEAPQAFIIMYIPLSEISPLLESQLANAEGQISVFDSTGEEIYHINTIGESIPINIKEHSGEDEERISFNGKVYIMQKHVSDSNGWTYVSVIKRSDMISGLAAKQLIFIILLLALMFLAVFAMLIFIVAQYKPISDLAESVTDKSDGEEVGEIIDENELLSSTFATLKDDSEQKQKFEAAYLEAEAANKAKSAFLSNMSHDIRTPMNAIVGMTAMASKHADDPDYVRECLDKVQVSSQYLLDIINNVLDMSRIESGKFTLTEDIVVIPKLIRELDTILKQNVEAKSQRLIFEVDNLQNERVVGDNVRIMQIFMNILSNSIKFTPEGGTIKLHIFQTACQVEGYGNYIFTFSDTGVGMADEFVKQVFDTFSRSREAGIANIEGTGLGMAIAKNLVDLMGGTIKCESQLGSGTIFTVTMRMKFAEAVEADGLEDDFKKYEGSLSGADNDMVIDLTGKRVLIVEDNLINREIAGRIISETNAEITEAGNGQEAVDIFTSHEDGYFDVILMDLQMPVMNGYEATKRIRSLERGDASTTPIYAMTANTFDEDVRQVRDASMDGHLGKPYTPAELYRVLWQAVKR